MALTKSDIVNNNRMAEYNTYSHAKTKAENRLNYLFWCEDCTEVEHMKMYDRWKPTNDEIYQEIEYLVSEKLPDIERHLELFEKSFPKLVPATMKRWSKRRQLIEKKGVPYVNRQIN